MCQHRGRAPWLKLGWHQTVINHEQFLPEVMPRIIPCFVLATWFCTEAKAAFYDKNSDKNTSACMPSQKDECFAWRGDSSRDDTRRRREAEEARAEQMMGAAIVQSSTEMLQAIKQIVEATKAMKENGKSTDNNDGIRGQGPSIGGRAARERPR